MQRLLTALGVVLLLLTTAFAVQNESPDGLRGIAAQRDFLVGAAVSMSALKEEVEYRQTLAREFNLIVPENAFKFEEIHPARDRYFFADADALVEFAEQNKLKLKGHTLVWHKQLPTWLTEGNWSRDEAIAILKDHIQTLVGRYRGKVFAWDVVNEAIVDNERNGLRRDSFWYRTIGPDYLRIAFEMAHEVDPDAILYYNDFSNEDRGKKSEVSFRLLSDLKNTGVPIGGVGWQLHLTPDFKIRNEHRENARRLVGLGLEISITELDVRVTLPEGAEVEAQQASVYRDVASFCLAQPNCRALILWGFTDKHSWIPGIFPGEGNALIFDANYRPKLAYRLLRGALEQSLVGSPRIVSATFRDDLLIVSGENFDDSATLLIEGQSVPTKSSKPPISLSTVIAARPAQKPHAVAIEVQNKDGKLSNTYHISLQSGARQ